MAPKAWIRSTSRFLLTAAAVYTASYLGYVAYAFLSYGKPRHTLSAKDRDSLLDRVMPTYEVLERHQIAIRAPAKTTFTSACVIDLQRSAIVRSIFKARQLLFGGKSDNVTESL